MSKKQNYDKIYQQYRTLVLQTAYKYSSDMYTAEDIMQDTFETLYKDYDKMNHSNIPSWLITTAKNKAINEAEKQGRTIPDSDRINEEGTMLQTPDVELCYLEHETSLERISLYYKIFAEMGKKSARWPEAMELVYLRGMSREDAAKEMGVSVGVLDSLLHRAKEWAKKEYKVIFKNT